MITRDQIIATLPSLSADDLTTIIGAARLAKAAPTAPDDLVIGRDYLFAGIESYLAKAGLLNKESWGLTRRGAYKDYRKKAPGVLNFLGDLQKTSGLLNMRHESQLGYICALALADWLKARHTQDGTLFSVSAMLSQIDKIPEALEEAFPGYLHAGLFGFIILNTRR